MFMLYDIKSSLSTLFSPFPFHSGCCSVTQLCPTLCDPCTAACQASLSFTISWSLLRLMSFESLVPTNHLIICRPLLLHIQSFPASGSFPELTLCIKWPKYWSFSFSISPSNEYLWLISFRIWLVWSPCSPRDSQESSPIPQLKASILWHSAFFMVQLAHPYMTTGKAIALTIWTFVIKVMSLLFNMLSIIVIAFLPRSKCLLISWLQSSSSVILEPKKIKYFTVFIVSPIYLSWSYRTRCHDLHFLNVEF